MGRLTRHDYNEDACDICRSWVLCKGKDCLLYDIYEKLAHYEDMEEAGRLIELPCALNTELYFVGQKSDGTYEICSKTLFTYDLCVLFGKHIGKGFYLTKEEAEAKLRDLLEIENVKVFKEKFKELKELEGDKE